jgi:hypothetical protein
MPRVSPASATTIPQAAAQPDQRPKFMCKPELEEQTPQQ